MQKPSFVYVSYIHTTPEKLWAALTQPEFTRKYWFDCGIESDWKVGSPVRFRRDGELAMDQVLLECTPPRRLAYTWSMCGDAEAKSERPSRVTFELEPVGDQAGASAPVVKLTVTHDDFPAGSVVFPRISQGWPVVLSNLKTLLESGQPMVTTWESCAATTKDEAVVAA